MTPSEYQDLCADYALPTARGLSYLIPGLCAEAGEVAGKYAKEIRDKVENNPQDATKEIGDVLWFCAMICNYYGVPMEDVMRQNIEKLESRKQRGKISGSGDDR